MQNKVAEWMKKGVRLVTFVGTSAVFVYSLTKYQIFRNLAEFSSLSEEYSNNPESLNNLKKNYEFGSGDLVFMTHNCSKGHSFSEIHKCYIHKLYKFYVLKTWQKDRYRQSS